MQLNKFYHVYNHANGDENLFRKEENYLYFLKLWVKYVEPIADTYAYCLMPNHFHALIRVKEEEVIRELIRPRLNQDVKMIVSKNFSNLFNAYAKAYNKMYDRRGSLFNRPFKSKEITSDDYLTAVINYIHRNPVHHGFCAKPNDWTFTSYHVYFSERKTKIKRDEVLRWYGGTEEMKKAHQLEPRIKDTSVFIDW